MSGNFLHTHFWSIISFSDEPDVCNYNQDRDSFPGGDFPPDFRWSLATAAYQIEGAWEEDGKGMNIWDIWSHQNTSGHCNVDDCMNGDVACDSYNQMDRDIKNIKSLYVSVFEKISIFLINLNFW